MSSHACSRGLRPTTEISSFYIPTVASRAKIDVTDSSVRALVTLGRCPLKKRRSKEHENDDTTATKAIRFPRCPPHGMDFLNRQGLNKGTAFTEDERSTLGLHGLLPPHVESLDEQVVRAYEAY